MPTDASHTARSGEASSEACRWCDQPAEVGGLCRPHFSVEFKMRREAQQERLRITGFVDGELPAEPGFRRD